MRGVLKYVFLSLFMAEFRLKIEALITSIICLSFYWVIFSDDFYLLAIL